MNNEHEEGLLSGIIVLDMSQFLAGPMAALRLGDLGARVIKIERPDGGDLCRRLYLSDTEIGGDSTLFHAINRGKESFAVNMKDEGDLQELRALIAKADVVIQNFRPGVIERLGLDYAAVAAINPRVVYGSITGYGPDNEWRHFPGQDLLAQARSGVMWLNGEADDGPVPFGLAIADMLAGNLLVQAILAGLVRRGVTGRGVHVETSLLEALVDFQFEVLTTHLNDGGRLPKKSAVRNAHAYLAAPYGVYRCADGWLAIAMMPLAKLAPLLDLPALAGYAPDDAFQHRDEIKSMIASRLREKTVQQWLAILEPADIWAAEVLDWPKLLQSAAFRQLDILQTVTRDDGTSLRTTASPIRVNGVRAKNGLAAPTIGGQSEKVRAEFLR
ncbi:MULTISPECIES: CaiB/BaiF CoA-transferase family protein [unclassified Rhizobium]|uniref:CaiB/BaiF CoA transferase family protein n=1 Tax=unclassified Rhizobium TaxID=2613769 RepID=UPI000DE19E55|nr:MULTISPECIES: CaiB/BaiF CoA-transferase family protein [unclassified Rhizobium]MBB3289862.1 crotonobetainyl-CoA:carnitine CoA-transferase CaiB-like acyl-CoA transferase [Rhizobium sp. BK252]MBB3404091.1 crotonobetainyl-CoA:carnitine CoA-transferase CaiB-like acyl-CoA transferase [Rhizobium sp. BK289]MBB3417190.1 crotonobetainyl-CoA:carnitine CoA-transferase CaiB-like acyl-CoA transferase [Rhizobium sp. BK284]MBB3485067.1 crotonobetainyl-CoA:carnitine CoA-transferase CaiB-like acyl-CoA transf